MSLSDLTDIEFVNADANTVQESIFQLYTDITGRTLSAGDPVRLFCLCIAEAFIRMLNNINYTGKQNLLKYAAGDYLDQLGALTATERIQASKATTTIQCTLSALRDRAVIIPAGTRVSSEEDIYFSTDKDLLIKAGNLAGDVKATCTVAGSKGNDLKVGEIYQIVDPVAYVATMENTTKSEGGSDTESDEAYRERIYEAPERFSTAGPSGAYEFWVKSASSLISDVTVYSPVAGTVEIRPLLTGGGIPGKELLDEVYATVTADKVRPLTDKVIVLAPEIVTYDLEMKYYIQETAQPATVEKDVNAIIADYITWQKSKIGRDINPSQLILMAMGISGVKRVDVIKPIFTSLTNVQVAVAGTVSVFAAGSEDE